MAESQSIKQITTISTAAAIDIGSNAIRMVVAQRDSSGHITILENLHQTVLLGHDTFTSGRIGKKAMQAAIAILRDFSEVLNLYKVNKVRAVATSAVREAANADVFLDRVLIATGMDIEVIDTSEESRLIVSAIYELVSDDFEVFEGNVLLVEAGGGSTILTILHNGDIVASHTIGLGSLKLLEEYYNWQSGWTEVYRQAIYRLETFVDTSRNILSRKKIDKLFLLGSDISFAAHRNGVPVIDRLVSLPVEKFTEYIDSIKELTPTELAMQYEDITLSTAETMNPTYAIYQGLINITDVKEVYVPYVNMRDGLVVDIFNSDSNIEQEFTWREAKHSAKVLAEKYQIKPNEYETILSWCQILFDALSPLHKLQSKEKVLLELAAILHRVGTYISVRAHHKHTYYIIANSEIFGLGSSELNLVAHIARYYRRSAPKSTHTNYMSLDRRHRIIINKLASILRLAVAIANIVKDSDCIEFSVTNDSFVIEINSGYLRGRAKSVLRAAAMLEDIFCISVDIREKFS